MWGKEVPLLIAGGSPHGCGLVFVIDSPNPPGAGLLLAAPAAGLYVGARLEPASLEAVSAAYERTARRRFWPGRGLYIDLPWLGARGDPLDGVKYSGLAAAGNGLRWVQRGITDENSGRGQARPGVACIPPTAVAVAAGEQLGDIVAAAVNGECRSLPLRQLLDRARVVSGQLAQPASSESCPPWTEEFSCVAPDDGSVRGTLSRLAGFSRGLWRKIAREGYLTSNGRPVHPEDRVAAGDLVAALTPPRGRADLAPELGPGPLAVCFEDAHLLVVDKPAGLLVHPARGETSGTLANRVAAYLAVRGSDATPRPVGRLDRGTSGLVVFAKTRYSQQALIEQHRSGTYQRKYLAITGPGKVPVLAVAELRAPVVSPPYDPQRYPSARDALTRIRVLAGYPGGLLVEAQPATGRTHQIRQHLSGAGLPLWGDSQYGGWVGGGGIDRPALHAWRLDFRHPVSGAEVSVRSPLPGDMCGLLAQLRAGRLPE